MPQHLQFRLPLALALLITATLMSCDLFSDSAPEAKKVKIIQEPFDAATIRKASFHIDTASIDGDLLRLTVVYKGGCREHNFELYGGSATIETNPLSAPAWLSHEARGDTCRESLRKEMSFDLSPIPNPYEAKVISISLHTYEGDLPVDESWYPLQYKP